MSDKTEKIKTLHSVSPLTDEGDIGGREPLYVNENDLSGLALGSLMAQEDLDCLSDVQSDSELSSSSNSQYSSRSFSLGFLSLPHHVCFCPVLQVECSSKVPAHLILAAANQTQSLSTP